MIATRFRCFCLACILQSTTATNAADMIFRPIASTGAYTISGRDILISPGAQRVFLEIKIQGFGPDILDVYQAKIDPDGYQSGTAGVLAPAFIDCPEESAAGNFFCRTQMADNGAGTSRCFDRDYGPNVDLQCEPAWVNRSQTNWVYYGHNTISAVDLSTPGFRWGAAAFNGEEAYDAGLEYYGGDLAIDVPADARGTFTIDFVELESWMGYWVGDDFFFIEPMFYFPARIAILCSQDAECNDGKDCTADVCDPDTHTCVQTPQEGAACNDGNLCTVDDRCQPDHCVGVTVVCPTPSPCHYRGTCNPQTGVCSAQSPKPNGTSCSDGNPCTLSDRCTSGTCTPGSPFLCTNGDDCHDPGVCEPATGQCSAPTQLSDGTPCSDEDYCTSDDACQGGACIGMAVPDCVPWVEAAACLTGPNVAMFPFCASFDSNADARVDLRDMADFVNGL